MKFEYKESFKHLCAKQLLLSWLRELDEKQDGCTFGPIYWRSNWGVHEELPFYETSDPYYFELSQGLIGQERKTKHYNHRELFDPTFNRGKLLFVPDITIFHKGTPIHFIEVVHKSFPVRGKVGKMFNFFYPEYSCNLWIVGADHILGQIKKPTSLNFKHIQVC